MTTDTRVFCFDLDGTLCTDEKGNYEAAKPYELRIAIVNLLYEKGHQIKIFTSRGSTTGIDWRELTLKQIQEWDICCHDIIMGKPHFDEYICDKSTNARDFFKDVDKP